MVNAGRKDRAETRPRDGESWAAIVKTIANMDTDEMLTFTGTDTELGRIIRKMPRGVQLKYLVVTHVFVSLITEQVPSAGSFRELMDRAEGKVKDHGDVTGTTLMTDDERWARIQVILDKVYGRKMEAEQGQLPPNDRLL